MKRIEILMNSKGYKLGYEHGKQEVIKKMLKFVDNECEFIPSKDSDSLLDRIVKELKKI
jgi:hypothetical protein